MLDITDLTVRLKMYLLVLKIPRIFETDSISTFHNRNKKSALIRINYKVNANRVNISRTNRQFKGEPR